MSMPAAIVGAAEPRAARAPMWSDGRRDANHIKLSWLLRLHWGGIVGQTGAIIAAGAIKKLARPSRALAAAAS